MFSPRDTRLPSKQPLYAQLLAAPATAGAEIIVSVSIEWK